MAGPRDCDAKKRPAFMAGLFIPERNRIPLGPDTGASPLVGADSLDATGDGLGQEHYIQQEALVVDVVHVVIHVLMDGDFAVRADLPEAGDAGLHVQALLVE